jgi:hypothetical protein
MCTDFAEKYKFSKIKRLFFLYFFICIKIKIVFFKNGVSSSLKLGNMCTDFAENLIYDFFRKI